MRLRFLGHAAFDLALAGQRLCLDPHKPGALGGRFRLPAIAGPFDAILHSHGHEDHAAWTPALGTTRVLDRPGQLGDVVLDTRPVFHDAERGLRMGLCRMLSLRGEGLRIVHCGDLGAWDETDVAWLRGTDVLLVPVGGTWTLDGAAAAQLVAQVAPRFVVPMHAADPRVDLALAAIADFLTAFAGPVDNLPELRLAAPPAAGPTTALVLSAP